MKLAAVLRDPWLGSAQRAEALGFDAVWIDEREVGAPLVVAAGAAAATRGVRLLACVDAGPHPVTLAEEAIVADLVSGGRLVLVVRSEDENLLTETIDVVRLALRPRPFRHDGHRWRIPARLPEHNVRGTLLRVTPAPAQLELPVWVTGPAGEVVARKLGVTHVGSGEGPMPDGPGPRVRRYDGADLTRLRADMPDLAVLDIPDAQLSDIATRIRPRLQLDALPPGLDEHWERAAANQPKGNG